MSHSDDGKKVQSEEFKGGCCQKEPSHLVIFDSGEENDVWFVCPDHIKCKEWNQFIVKILEVTI